MLTTRIRSGKFPHIGPSIVHRHVKFGHRCAFVFSSSAFANGSLRVRRDVQAMPETDRFFCDYAEAVRAMHELPEDHPRSWR